jgi:tetratricopeptide (TPR) repeat protein
LIDARNDLHLWAQTYERDLSDVLALQSDVARAVSEQVQLKLTPEEEAALTASRSVDPRAYDAYLRGLESRGPGTFVRIWGPKAIEQYVRAVELDPNFAEGWVALAATRAILGFIGFDLRYRGELPKAREAAQRALEIDDHLGGAHATVGLVQLWYDWDFPGARRALERALDIDPSNPQALNAYAHYLLFVEGRTQEALDLSERLLRVAPLDPFWRGERFKHLVFAREYQRALDEVERIWELDPSFVSIQVADTYSKLGRFEEAYRASLAFVEQCGAPCDWMREAFERGMAEGGLEAVGRTWLEAATKREGHSPWHIAAVYAGNGKTDEAFAWLERGYRERDPLMICLKAHFSFDSLRSDPRFDDLLRRIGFPGE